MLDWEARIQYGNDRHPPVVGVVEGLPGASLPRRTPHPLARSRVLRFCRAGSAAAQRPGSGEHDRGTGTSDQRIDYRGDRPPGAEVAGGARRRSIGPAGAGGTPHGGGPGTDRVCVPGSRGGDGGCGQWPLRRRTGHGGGPAEEVGAERTSGEASWTSRLQGFSVVTIVWYAVPS